MKALETFFLAVLLVIIATYLLFIAGSAVFCRILKKNRHYYYQAKHFVSVSAMMYRMKRNGAGLASICVLSTVVLVMVSATICLYSGKEQSLRRQYPRDIQVTVRSLDETYLNEIHGAVSQAEKESGITEKNRSQYRCLAFGGMIDEDQVTLSIDNIVAASGMVDYGKITELVFVPLEDYNALTGKEETLKSGEALLCCTREGKYNYDTISIEGMEKLQIKAQVPEFVSNGEVSAVIMSAIYIVVPDIGTLEKADAAQKQACGENASEPYEYYGFDLDGGDGQQQAVTNRILEKLGVVAEQNPERGTYSVSCIANERAYFYGMYGGLFVVGTILGSVFIVAAVLIMYYKQITEGYEDCGWFRAWSGRNEPLNDFYQKAQIIVRHILNQLNCLFL